MPKFTECEDPKLKEIYDRFHAACREALQTKNWEGVEKIKVEIIKATGKSKNELWPL